MRRRSLVLACTLATVVASGSVEAYASASAPSTARGVSAPADADAVVSLASTSDIEIVGSSAKTVEVFAPDGLDVDVTGSGRRIAVRVTGGSSSKRVRVAVPAGVTLDVAVQSADVRAQSLAGRMHVTSISGDIEITGAAGRMDVATTSGRIRVEGGTDRLDVSTISGDVHVEGSRGELRVESVSGNVTVRRADLERTSIATVSGRVELTATLRKGPHDVNTHSGVATMRLPIDRPLTIDVSTFSARIVDELGPQTKKTQGRYERVIGTGGPRLSISTFSGKVTLATR